MDDLDLLVLLELVGDSTADVSLVRLLHAVNDDLHCLVGEQTVAGRDIPGLVRIVDNVDGRLDGEIVN